MTDPATETAGGPEPVEVPEADFLEQQTDAVTTAAADPEQPIPPADPAPAVAEGDPEADPADVAEQALAVGDDADDYPAG